MSIEIRIVMPRRLYYMLEEKAKKVGLSLNDLVVYTLSKVAKDFPYEVKEEVKGTETKKGENK